MQRYNAAQGLGAKGEGPGNYRLATLHSLIMDCVTLLRIASLNGIAADKNHRGI